MRLHIIGMLLIKQEILKFLLASVIFATRKLGVISKASRFGMLRKANLVYIDT